MKIYGKYKPIRRLADKFEASKIVNRTFSYMPAKAIRKTLLVALPEDIYPRLEAEHPCLIEIWEDADEIQVHLVNYASKPQELDLHFQDPVHWFALSPDSEGKEIYQGNPIRISVDTYKILLISSK